MDHDLVVLVLLLREPSPEDDPHLLDEGALPTLTRSYRQRVVKIIIPQLIVIVISYTVESFSTVSFSMWIFALWKNCNRGIYHNIV